MPRNEKTDDELVEEILDLKDDVETWKTRKAVLDGKMEQEMESLSDDHDVTTIKAAQTLQTKLNRRSVKLRKQLEEGLEELKDEFSLTSETD